LAELLVRLPCKTGSSDCLKKYPNAVDFMDFVIITVLDTYGKKEVL